MLDPPLVSDGLVYGGRLLGLHYGIYQAAIHLVQPALLITGSILIVQDARSSYMFILQ